MANPTEATIQDQIGERILLLEILRKTTTDNAQNILDQEDVAVQNMEGDYEDDSIAGMSSFRSLVSSAIAASVGRAMLDPKLLDYAKVLGLAERDPFRIIFEINKHFAATAQSVQTRNFTYGAPVLGGSNVGNGTLHRITTDRFGNDLEAVTAEIKEFVCTNDQGSGANEGAEQFRVQGEAGSRDNIDRESGSGATADLNAIVSDGGEFLRNASFSSATGTGLAADFELTNWDIDDPTQLQIDEVNFYRPGSSQDFDPASLEMHGNVIISQPVTNIDPDKPIIGLIAFNASVGSAVGDLKIRLGQISKTVVAVGGFSPGWNVFRFILVASEAWALNITADDMKLEVEFVATSGVLRVDDVILANLAGEGLIDGTYWGIVGGDVPFLIDDQITVTDTLSVLAILQVWFWRIYARHLRSSGSPTWVDPT